MVGLAETRYLSTRSTVPSETLPPQGPVSKVFAENMKAAFVVKPGDSAGAAITFFVSSCAANDIIKMTSK